jgi:ketosteroid isomerase-like protein
MALTSNPTLEQFEAAFRSANAAFNNGDFATAFASLPPDCEYHVWNDFLTARVGEETRRVLVGPAQVSRFFEEIIDTFPDFSNEPVHFLQAADGVFVVLHHARGVGRASRVPTGVDGGHVWELQDRIPVRVREYPTWEGTLSAAGLDPSTAAELRKAERS